MAEDRVSEKLSTSDSVHSPIERCRGLTKHRGIIYVLIGGLNNRKNGFFLYKLDSGFRRIKQHQSIVAVSLFSGKFVMWPDSTLNLSQIKYLTAYYLVAIIKTVVLVLNLADLFNSSDTRRKDLSPEFFLCIYLLVCSKNEVHFSSFDNNRIFQHRSCFLGSLGSIKKHVVPPCFLVS